MKNEDVRAGILGGTGKMGRLMAGILERAGVGVITAGRGNPGLKDEILLSCDIVMVSVPIHATVPVIEEIAPFLREDQLVCDLTSLKVAPVKAMLRSRARVIGLHPMFGPSAASISGQTVIATPARCSDADTAFWRKIFTDEGASFVITTPEEHDRRMAVVQGLTHFVTISVAETMRRTGVAPRDTVPFMSPVYRIEADIVGRLLSQDPVLYRDMLQLNPYVPAVLAACEEAVKGIRAAVEGGDPQAFVEIFRMNADHFGDFCAVGMKETDALISAMVQGVGDDSRSTRP